MKTAMHTDRLERRFGAIGAVRMLGEAGFEAVDYSMYYPDIAVFGRGGRILAGELSRVAASYGMVINQTHAPFSDFKRGEESCEHNRKVYNSICEAIRISAAIGAKAVVVHPAEICPYLTADERFDMNMELFAHLISVARGEGIDISIENLYSRHLSNRDRIIKGVCSDSYELLRYLDALSEYGVSFCLDVGHAELAGEGAYSMIKTLGKRISYVHIHDNDINSDEHTLPYLASIDFDGVCKALGKIGYDGDITLEADGFLRDMPDAVVPSALSFARNIASHLRDEVVRYREKYS